MLLVLRDYHINNRKSLLTLTTLEMSISSLTGKIS